MEITPAPVFQGNEHGVVLVRHQNMWRRVVGVSKRNSDTRIFLEVARARKCGSLRINMDICEIVGPSVVKSANINSMSELLSNRSLRINPFSSWENVHSLRWETIAYRCPKPGKRYENLPETVMVGSTSGVRWSPRISCSRSDLRRLYDGGEVDQFLWPLFDAIHDAQISKGIPKTWQPPQLRKCSPNLRDCLQHNIKCMEIDQGEQTYTSCRLARQCSVWRSEAASDAPDSELSKEFLPGSGIKRMIHDSTKVDESQENVPMSCFGNQTTTRISTQDIESREDEAVRANRRSCESSNASHRPGKRNSTSPANDQRLSRLELLQSELWNAILDFVQDSNWTSDVINGQWSPSRLGRKQSDDDSKDHSETLKAHTLDQEVSGLTTETTQFPALLLTSRTCREFSLDWFYRQVLEIKAKYWPMGPIRRFETDRLTAHWLQNARKVRIDCSGLSFQQLNAPHTVVTQLANIWRATNTLTSLIVFVPPLYESLRHLSSQKITWDPNIEKLVEPLLQLPALQCKTHIDPTDFAGEVSPGLSALHVAAAEGDEEVVRFLLGQSRATLNKLVGGLTPLHFAAENGHLGVTKQLVAIDEVDVNSRGSRNFTPIHIAIEHLEIVQCLLETGKVDLTAKALGKTPLQMAQEESNDAIVQLLLRYLSMETTQQTI